ncbi:hypothetical protein L6164_019430 [Bauhinia variegata]|uniref:Uncharacterized protein n=1 Tax=Bauhinia variegata TaxID=167791 RepID=A0ACB9MSI7_BAUVA|nr:hypothetical protein L6164_019430 [Bauhinia variegata]
MIKVLSCLVKHLRAGMFNIRASPPRNLPASHRIHSTQLLLSSTTSTVIVLIMRGLVALLPAEKRFIRLYRFKGSWAGTVATSAPKKQEDNKSDKGGLVTKEKMDPIVTFTRPPPLPPLLGPLVAISLLETWSSRDTDDDGVQGP